MAGDVNLYLLDPESEGVGEPNTVVAELEVMVAESEWRRKGIATDALKMMIAYARLHWRVEIFVSKVLDSNLPSLKLFEGVLGSEVYRKVKPFGEVHMKLLVDAEIDKKLFAQRDTWKVQSYKETPYCTTSLQKATNCPP